jgi:single-strand DNA-binding protein
MLNRVILIGRLTKDPELRYTPAGVAVAQFTLAIDRPFTNSQSKERETDFLNIVTWNKLAETCANYLRKGRLTAVEGRIQTRNYDNSEGKKVYVTEVVADNVRFLESSNSGTSGREEMSSSDQSPTKNIRPSSTRTSQQDPFYDDSKPIDISDDDLPF